MSNTYIKRSLEPVVKKAAAEFPAVVLTGRVSPVRQRFSNTFSAKITSTFL